MCERDGNACTVGIIGVCIRSVPKAARLPARVYHQLPLEHLHKVRRLLAHDHADLPPAAHDRSMGIHTRRGHWIKGHKGHTTGPS